jgi:thiamine biosynthesis lipoprotein
LTRASRIVLLVVLAVATLSPTYAAPPAVRYEDSHNAMGTVFAVVAYGRDRDYLSEVVREVFEEFDRLDAQMSNYRPASELSGINREAARQAVIVAPDLFHLIQDSLRVSEETGGAFDITVGPLVKAWGFFRGQGRVPNSEELAEILKHVGYRHVHLDAERRQIRFDTPGVEIDLGAIAKGYALDRAAAILRADGVTSALLSSGSSSIYALGSPPGERGWKVSIRDPYDKEKAADVVLLKNYALSVSGNYEKFFKLRGKIYSHILDPKSGRPVEQMLSTAVLAPAGEQTDALSTSFYVLGAQGSREFLRAHRNLTVIFYLPGDSSGDFKRVILKSDSFSVPSDSLAEIEHSPSRP